MLLPRLSQALRGVAAAAVIVGAAVLVAPGLSGPRSVGVDPVAAASGPCRDGSAVVVGWIVDEQDPHLTTGVRVGGLSEHCSHNKIRLEVFDAQGNVMTSLATSLASHGGEVVLDFAAPIQAAPVAEVEVVLSGAKRP